MIYFTLNAHKKCIGQYNFDPLLYWDQFGNPVESLYLDTVGTYTIKYVSGAICSFNIDTIINQLSSVNKNISQNQIYWNRYYDSTLVSLGQYDITYFPTSSILLACFQCQFGTLPGFTDQGYMTKALAETFNSYYLNNTKNKYNFTDELKFNIDSPQNLIFWYNNITEQSVEGSITYCIDYVKEEDQTVYLNDISVISINKNDISQCSFEDYYLNLNKENLSNTQSTKLQLAWINDINNRNIVKNICDFNTVGYSSAYINDIKYTDTLHYEKEYSQLYYWELHQKTDSPYVFIGKFSNKMPKLLLYKGYYTIFLANNNDYTFKINHNIKQQTGMSFLTSEMLNNNITYTFSVNTVQYIDFSFLYDNYQIYLYKGYMSINQLNIYITKLQNNRQFVTEYSSKTLELLKDRASQSISNITNIIDYNENIYNYYVDISQYVYYNTQSISFNIYTAQNIKNSLSIGPYLSVETASASIFKIFTELSGISDLFVCTPIQTNDNSLQYIVSSQYY